MTPSEHEPPLPFSNPETAHLRKSALALVSARFWEMTREQAELILETNAPAWKFSEDDEGAILRRLIPVGTSDYPFGISQEFLPAVYGPDDPLIRNISFDQTHEGTEIIIRPDPNERDFNPYNLAGIQLIEALIVEKGFDAGS